MLKRHKIFLIRRGGKQFSPFIGCNRPGLVVVFSITLFIGAVVLGCSNPSSSEPESIIGYYSGEVKYTPWGEDEPDVYNSSEHHASITIYSSGSNDDTLIKVEYTWRICPIVFDPGADVDCEYYTSTTLDEIFHLDSVTSTDVDRIHFTVNQKSSDYRCTYIGCVNRKYSDGSGPYHIFARGAGYRILPDGTERRVKQITFYGDKYRNL